MTNRTARLPYIKAAPPSREDTFKYAQQAMDIALHLEEGRAIPMKDGTWLKLDTPKVRKSICDDALNFMREVTLEEDLVPAQIVLERINVYLRYPAEGDNSYRYEEAVYSVCFVLALYEKSHADFEDHFPDDKEILVELAMAGEAVTSFLRFLNNGRRPKMMSQCSATPRLVALSESLRRAEPQVSSTDGATT